MKEKLEAHGWICQRCSCPGNKGFDCVNPNFRKVVIQERGTAFKIFRNSLMIESAYAYQLDEKLKFHGLI